MPNAYNVPSAAATYTWLSPADGPTPRTAARDRRAAGPEFLARRAVERIQHSRRRTSAAFRLAARQGEDDTVDDGRRHRRDKIARCPLRLQRWRVVLIDDGERDERARLDGAIRHRHLRVGVDGPRSWSRQSIAFPPRPAMSQGRWCRRVSPISATTCAAASCDRRRPAMRCRGRRAAHPCWPRRRDPCPCTGRRRDSM